MKKLIPILMLALLFACKNEQKEAPKQDTLRPNIIFIMTDDHAKKALSIYDNSLISTPNMDRIGQEGIVFNRAFVTNSICGPSRAVFLTGKYSHINGFRNNSDSFDGSQETLAKILKRNGYYTSVVGKWHLKSTPTGFNYWNVLIGQGHYYNPTFIEMGDTLTHNGYATNIITDMAIETIEKRVKPDQPFFLMVHQKAPHRNWMPDTSHLGIFKDVDFPLAETFYDDYEGRTSAAKEQDMEIRNMYLSGDMKLDPNREIKETGSGGSKGHDAVKAWENTYARMDDAQKAAWDQYYKPISDAYYRDNLSGKELDEWKYQRYLEDYLGCIVSVDENIGRLYDYLKEKELLDNTLIVYTSDQGFYLGEHGWYDKRFMYEPSFGTPLLMRLPGIIQEGFKTDELVLNVDLAPTLLKIAGIEPPEEMQGESLIPLMSNKKTADWRKSVYYHYYQSGAWHYVKKHLGVRTDRYKLIHFYEVDEWELYDLKKDPEEMNNLYPVTEYADLVDSLKIELSILREHYKDTE